MKQNPFHIIITAVTILSVISCRSPQRLFAGWYKENEKKVDIIEEKYKRIYPLKPFSIEFKDKSFNHLALEIDSDTLRHIYSFYLDESFLADTLTAYGFDVNETSLLINKMHDAQCTWVGMIDYYEKRKEKEAIYISIRHKLPGTWLNGYKYYSFVFFSEPQSYDDQGRLLDGQGSKELRLLNGNPFFRIDDKLFYCVSRHFR